MPDINTIQTLTGTAMFSKKVSDGNYGGEEASLFVQFEIDPSAPATEINAAAIDAFNTAKAHVLAQLNIGAVPAIPTPSAPAEVILGNFPGSSVEPTPTAAPNAAAPAPTASAPSTPSNGAHPQTFAQCAKCGQTGFWDNRADNAKAVAEGNAQASKRPGFKCKNKQCGNGVWEKN